MAGIEHKLRSPVTVTAIDRMVQPRLSVTIDRHMHVCLQLLPFLLFRYLVVFPGFVENDQILITTTLLTGDVTFSKPSIAKVCLFVK